MECLGRPEHLSFKAVCEFERSKLKTPAPPMVSARYRLTDGAFRVQDTRANGDVIYEFSDTEPKPADLPAAVGVRLPKRK